MTDPEPPSEPLIIDPSEMMDERTARRRHMIFLGVTAAIAIGVILAARSVLLPFVLALVIAYVLTPLVGWVERKRVPRPLAIILVYIVVLGSIGGFIRISAPRVVHELAGLRRELPVISKTIREEWVPQAQRKLRDVGLGAEPPPSPSAAPTTAPTTAIPRAPPQAPAGPAGAAGSGSAPLLNDRDGDGIEDPPALVAKQRPDGSFAIEFQGPIAVHPTKGGGYTIEPVREQRGEPFNLDVMVADVAGKSLLYAQHNALEIVKIGRDIIAGVSRFFFIFGVTLMLAAYTMLTRDRIMRFFTSLLRPKARPSWHALVARIDRGLAGVVRGQLVICLVNGVLSAIGFAIVDLRYWPVLALVATVLSLIPIFGSIVSAVPAVALGLTQSFGTAVFVLVWIIGIHQLEANLLNPKILGDAAKIHPVLVIFSLLVGEHFFGVVGALLAVPVMSIAQSVFIHVRKNIQASDPEMSTEPVGSIIPPPP